MPRRTQIYQKIPWTGGVNSSVDPGVLPPNELVQADNVVFDISGTRLKRQGFDYFDYDIPTVTHRSSSGTARTLIFSSSVNLTTPSLNHLIVVGEKLRVSGSVNAAYNTDSAIVSTLGTTNVANDTITYTFVGAGALTEGSTADSAATVTRNYDIIANHEYWYYDVTNNTKVQEHVAVTSQGKFFRYDEIGRRAEIPMSGADATALATTVTQADLLTFNNRLIIGLTGIGNTPKYYYPVVALEWKDLPNAPDGWMMREHLGRIFMNDKLNPDFLHYSETFNETQWLGLGDSGGLPISEGDGDDSGISAIFPPFKGRLVVAKTSKKYQMIGDAPETFYVSPMTNGVGSASHKSVVSVDFDDVYDFSKRGIHSIVSTDQFGDFSGQFLSGKIQRTFNTWTADKLNLVQGVYLNKINSAAWIVPENGIAPTAVWLYNPTIPNEGGAPGVWFRWPNLNPRSISKMSTETGDRVMIGNDKGRLLLGMNGKYEDPGGSGISLRFKSGTIYPDGNPQSIKGFKKFGVLFKPQGRFSFTAYFKVDKLPAQAVTFIQSVIGEQLGSTFVLGSSLIGSNTPLSPFMKDVFGHGRGCSIEIFQSGAEAQVEIYGYIIEYELQDVADEVND